MNPLVTVFFRFMPGIKPFLFRCIGIITSTILVGCASSPELYHWGDLENTLHNRYVTQDDSQADVYLVETIRTAEQRQLKVPPGAYADYGFILFKRGDREGAVTLFEKEKQLFPESNALMTKLIERVQQNNNELTKRTLPQAIATPESQP